VILHGSKSKEEEGEGDELVEQEKNGKKCRV